MAGHSRASIVALRGSLRSHLRVTAPQMPKSDSISELKSVIRKDALMRRDALPVAERAKAAQTIAARALPVAVNPDTIVSGFMPLKTEIGRASCRERV